MSQEIAVPLNTTSIDDYLLDMARSTHINVFADASDFPAQSAVKPYPATSGAIEGLKGPYGDKWGPILLNVLHELAAQKQLSTLRYDDRTFLFWSEPEQRQLAATQWALTQATEEARFKDAIDDAKAKGVPEAEIIRGPVSQLRLQLLLMDYLVNEHDWKGDADQLKGPVDIETHLEELSPTLRALVLLDLRQHFSQLDGHTLPEDFWEQNNLHLRLEKNQQKNQPSTILQGEYRVKEDARSESRRVLTLAIIDDTAPAPAQGVAPASAEDPVAATIQTPLVPIPLGAQDTLLNAYSGLSDQTTDATLDADAALSQQISLQVKRLPLRDLLAQLEQQSGVHFTLGEAAPADKLITASIEKMTLSRVMGALSRVYGVKWKKGEATAQGTGYILRGNDQGELHLRLLQMGDPQSYLSTNELFFRPDRKRASTALGQALVQQIGEEALSSPQGVAYSSLTPELQQQVKHIFEAPPGRSAALSLYYVNRMLAEQLSKKGLVLRFGNADRKKYRAPYGGGGMSQSPDELRFNVQSDDEQVVLPVFDTFSINTKPAPPHMLPLPVPMGQPAQGVKRVFTVFH